MKKIDWKRIWADFDEWYAENINADWWEDQQPKIQKLVEAQLKKRGGK